MKRILFLIILFSATLSQAQLNVWRWQNPLPVGNYLRAVQMVSLNTVYACGDEATVMRSGDGGTSWDTKSKVLGLGANFNALSFCSENYGMCAGDSGKVIRTTDGGVTWQKVNAKTTVKINGILVIDTLTAIFVTHTGAILKSVDGGATWAAAPTEGLPELLSIRMLRPDFITITGTNGYLLRSRDKFATPPARIPVVMNGLTLANVFYSADFTDENTCTLIGDGGFIFHTSNGGAAWTQQQVADSNVVTAALNMIDGKNSSTLTIVGSNGTILNSLDGGLTWKQNYLDTRYDINALSFFDNMTAVAVGNNGLVIKTSDAGMTWKYLPHQPFTALLQAVAFPKGDTSLGIAAGNGGTIMRTPDGGKNWSVVPSGTTNDLYGVAFADQMHVFAVGDFGTVIASTDAGLTWAKVSSGTGNMLRAVCFADAKSGIIAGDNGTIMTTTTGGLFWTNRFTTPTTKNFLNSVSFPDPKHAFIGGLSALYKTTDGGINWSPAPGAAHSNSMSVSFSDSLHGGFIFNDRFTVGYSRSTSDGGVTFDSTYPDRKGRSLYALCFSDSKHATAVGAFGIIYHSTDNGHSWIVQTSNTSNSLYAIAFGTLKAGTAVGVRGNIMRITTDEFSGVHQIGAAALPKIIIATYPNPFSGETTIHYTLPSSGIVTAEIYSIDGKRIATLANQYEAFGEHSLLFGARSIASGIYLVRITCAGMSASGELVVRH